MAELTVFVSIAVALTALCSVLLLVLLRTWKTVRRQRTDLHSGREELKSSYDSIVAVLCAALDLRDNVTQGHAVHVSDSVV